jgi:hypothetical protein
MHKLHKTIMLPYDGTSYTYDENDAPPKSGIKKVPIDINMASIMKVLWAAGIKTRECCQGDGKSYGYICFTDFESAQLFHKKLYYLDMSPWLGDDHGLEKWPPLYMAMVDGRWSLSAKGGGRLAISFEFTKTNEEGIFYLQDMVKYAFKGSPE